MQAAWPPAECTCAQIQMLINLGTLSFGRSMCHQFYAQRPCDKALEGVADTLDCPVSCMAMRLQLPCTETSESSQMVLDRPCVHSRVLAAMSVLYTLLPHIMPLHAAVPLLSALCPQAVSLPKLKYCLLAVTCHAATLYTLVALYTLVVPVPWRLLLFPPCERLVS